MLRSHYKLHLCLLALLFLSPLRSRANLPAAEGAEPDWTPGVRQAFPKEFDGQNINIPKLLPLILKRAAQSNAFAQGFLGHLLIRGEYITQDIPTGFRLLHLAAEKHLPHAEAELGCRYLLGQNTETNLDQSFYWLRRGADDGEPWAQYNLAYSYERGLGISVNYPAAATWYYRVVEHPNALNAYAYMRLGLLYSAGWGVNQDPAEARRLWLLSANLGDAMAMYHLAALSFATALQDRTNTVAAQDAFAWTQKCAALGKNYGHWQWALCDYYGIGTPTNFDDYLTQLTIAADAGVPDAQNALGNCYEIGFKVPTNITVAAQWYGRSASNDFPLGCYSLAQLLLNTNYGKVDYTNALAYLLRAAELGHRQAQYRYAVVNLEGKLVPTNNVVGDRWLKQAAEGGWPDAEWTLSLFYHSGTAGIPKDETLAFNWCALAAQHGHPAAQDVLGSRFVQGAGVNKDLAAGIKWLRLSAAQGYVNGENDLGYALIHQPKSQINLVEAYTFFLLASRQDSEEAKKSLAALKPNLTPEQYFASLEAADKFRPQPRPALNPLTATPLIPAK